MIKPRYPNRRIGTISALCAALDVTERQIRSVVSESESYYTEAKTLKKNGKPRDIVIVSGVLRDIQQSIKRNLLDKVQMPDYLIGGIKQRDFRLHAQHHCNSEILIQEDIHNFFPSITMDQVKRIWTDLFKFGDEVAALLTKLTVYRGSLPQGAKTSVGLANLVLFQYEAQFYEWCKKRQLSYTRYIDDISISSHRKITTDEKTIIINKLYGMLLKAGFKPQRSKHQCSTASQRMEIMGMVVNRGKPTLTQEYRRNVRALIHTLHMTSRGRLNKQTPQFLSAMGKINHLGRYHPKEAERLKEKLLECCNNKCTTVV